jgi:hypothetical protein
MSQLTHINILKLLLKFQAPIFTFWSCSVGCFTQETLLLNMHARTSASPFTHANTQKYILSKHHCQKSSSWFYFLMTYGCQDRQTGKFFHYTCTNRLPGSNVTRASKFCTVLPNIWPSVWNMLDATLLGCTVLTYCLHICKIEYHWTKDPVV